MSRFLSTFLLIATLAAAPALHAQEVDTMALRAHTMFLAHDMLEGRGTGSRGERLAALYIASQLQRLGIPGAGPRGEYFQPVPLREATVDYAATRLTVARGSEAATFGSPEHFVLNTGGKNAFRSFAGSALFAGTAGFAGEALERRGSLDGQVVVVLGTLGTEAQTLIPDWIRRGAEGVVFLVTESDRYGLFVRSRGDSRLFVDAEVGDPIWQPDLPVLVAGPRLSAAILAGAPLAPDALDGKKPFHALPLERTVSAEIGVSVRNVAAANVAALLPGQDPAKRDEVIVYTAHYDHLGIGTPDARGDSVYNGFSDNAAGTAMLLAIADAMRQGPPDRSVLFLFVTGEERGLLGSSYYASAPLIPLARTAAVINLDAGAPPAPPRSWRVAGGKESTLGALATRVAAARGWTAAPSNASPNSDYWPFLNRGVPAVFVIPGQDWEGVGKAQKEELHRRWDHYHEAADEWKPDFPFRGLQRYADFALALGREAGNAAQRPRITENAAPER